MKVCKVYVEPPKWFGTVMRRINTQVRRYAPPCVRFVNDPKEADFQILDCVGPSCVNDIVCKKYVLHIQGCYPSWVKDKDFWTNLWKSSLLNISFADAPGIMGSSDFPFLRLPWGVDSRVFYPRKGVDRPACVMTSGYDPDEEAIREFREAARKANQPMIHLGPTLPFLNEPGIVTLSGISDDELAVWYTKSQRVSGLRRGSGFELGCLEGVACGARPVVFDTPDYRFWYSDFAEFVPELPAEKLTPVLIDLLQRPPEPVTEKERKSILSRFEWSAIMPGYWKAILSA